MSEDVINNNSIPEIIMRIISDVPESSEEEVEDPILRARIIAKKAAINAATISGTLAIPPGPWGMATVLPDLIAIWKLQRQMVADIASVFGKKSILGKKEMVYCLFKHTAGQTLRTVVVRVGERYLVKRTSLRFIQQTLSKIGVRITQRVAGRSLSRWIPIIGAVGISGYAYYDTAQVAKTAIDFFSSEIEHET